MARSRTLALLVSLALGTVVLPACRAPGGAGGGGAIGWTATSTADGGVGDGAIDPSDPSEATGMGGGADVDRVLGPSGPFASTLDPCTALTPTIRGTDGADTIRGTDHRDVIFAGAGDDTIWGNGGDDVICAGGGEDVVEGGIGADYIDGGFGQDRINGGAGPDVLHGRSGGDILHGDAGDDRIFGDLLDDHLYGDDDDDLLVGGHGVDFMHGGTGDDWLRGDTNRDELIGGAHAGYGDTASFMTTTPPGQTLSGIAPVSGIIVDNRDQTAGLASGDGASEPLVGIENVLGSAFDDHVFGGEGTTFIAGSYGDDVLEGSTNTALDPGVGADTCTGRPCTTTPDVRGDRTLVFVSPEPSDTGLAVLGSAASDTLTISFVSGIAQVRSDGAPLAAGAGCSASPDERTVTCAVSSELRYIVAHGGDGDDEIVLEGSFPRDMEATMDGGNGDDLLRGHAGQDILFAGPTGHDTLEGLGGDDALLSESRDSDVMDAGPGNDQLVASWPCAGHVYIGGPGQDVAGFARVGNFETAAERRRQSIHAQIGGRSFQPAFCSQSEGTQVHADTEILEGAGGDDVLIGSDGPDILWGREGNDELRGLGGNDVLEGLRGDDEIHGGAGRDRLLGGDGHDRLYGLDGETDLELAPGIGGCIVNRDESDPRGPTCMSAIGVGPRTAAR